MSDESFKQLNAGDRITSLKCVMATTPDAGLMNVLDGRIIMDILEEQEARIKRLEKLQNQNGIGE